MLIGQDTRRSGDMLVAAVAAGAMSLGVDVDRLGVCPTPALALLTADAGYSAGIMVSASHNPADDNGLKVVDRRGLKLDDVVEDELEAHVLRADELVGPPTTAWAGSATRMRLLDDYVEQRLGARPTFRFDGRIVVDCANGSGGAVAPRILAATGADVDAWFDEPDGMNINLDCGATAPEQAAASGR